MTVEISLYAIMTVGPYDPTNFLLILLIDDTTKSIRLICDPTRGWWVITNHKKKILCFYLREGLHFFKSVIIIDNIEELGS